MLYRPNLFRAIFGGIFAGVVAAFIWGSLVGITGLQYELEWFPMVGLGFLVGTMVRVCGNGNTIVFSVIGASIAFVAAVLGDLFTTIIAASWQIRNIDNFLLWSAGWNTISRLYWENFGRGDVVFLALTVYEGWSLSRSTEERRRSDEIRANSSMFKLQVVGVCVGGFSMLVLGTWLSVSRWAINGITQSRRGTQVAIEQTTIDGGGTICLLDGRTDKTIVRIGGSGEDPTITGGDCYRFPAFCNDGNNIVYGRLRKEARENAPGLRTVTDVFRLDVSRRRQPTLIVSHQKRIRQLVFDGNRSLVVVADNDHCVVAYHIDEGSLVGQCSFSDAITCLALARDGRQLAIGTSTGAIQLLDTATWQSKPIHGSHDMLVKGLVFSSSGRTLVSVGGLDRMIKVWHTRTGTLKTQWPVALGWLTAIDVAPRGPVVAVGGGGFDCRGQAQLINLEHGTVSDRFFVETNTVTALRFSADGQTLYAGSGHSTTVASWHSQGKLYAFSRETKTRRLIELSRSKTKKLHRQP